jgi:tRNA A-37 threonylcarbamoyl transferase component Bud32
MGALVEINPHPWITTNRFYLSVDRSVILKVYCPKRAGFSHYKYRVMRLFGYRIPYEFRSGVERCQHEREICAHWYASGYKVPRIIDDAALPLPAPSESCLAFEFLDGIDLRTVLADRGIDPSVRLDLVAGLFDECSRRHARVFAKQDCRLIKYDANLRNLMVVGSELFHIDFEAGRVGESLERGAAREVTRYAVEAIKMMGREYSAKIIAILKLKYKHTKVVEWIMNHYARRRSDRRGKFGRPDLARLLIQSPGLESRAPCVQ